MYGRNEMKSATIAFPKAENAYILRSHRTSVNSFSARGAHLAGSSVFFILLRSAQNARAVVAASREIRGRRSLLTVENRTQAP